MTTRTVAEQERLTYATDEDLEHVASLVSSIRYDWERYMVRLVLEAHRHQVDVADLAVAAIRAAHNRELHTPKTIGWRGPHWDHARIKPPEVRSPRCRVCGKREDRCATERPGSGDDHEFEPAGASARPGRLGP